MKIKSVLFLIFLIWSTHADQKDQSSSPVHLIKHFLKMKTKKNFQNFVSSVITKLKQTFKNKGDNLDSNSQSFLEIHPDSDHLGTLITGAIIIIIAGMFTSGIAGESDHARQFGYIILLTGVILMYSNTQFTKANKLTSINSREAKYDSHLKSITITGTGVAAISFTCPVTNIPMCQYCRGKNAIDSTYLAATCQSDFTAATELVCTSLNRENGRTGTNFKFCGNCLTGFFGTYGPALTKCRPIAECEIGFRLPNCNGKVMADNEINYFAIRTASSPRYQIFDPDVFDYEWSPEAGWNLDFFPTLPLPPATTTITMTITPEYRTTIANANGITQNTTISLNCASTGTLPKDPISFNFPDASTSGCPPCPIQIASFFEVNKNIHFARTYRIYSIGKDRKSCYNSNISKVRSRLLTQNR
eukprot:c21058_g1_i1.p1 GENE.c21058_g1_i1~~c21058_g1_i1.p1  ORF type:complete len:417 (+),score=85.72 c21058_g1_i1:23-1273(+)